MGSLSLVEVALILGVAMLLFGAKRVGAFGRSVRGSLRDFKEGMNEEEPPPPAELPEPPQIIVKSVERSEPPKAG